MKKLIDYLKYIKVAVQCESEEDYLNLIQILHNNKIYAYKNNLYSKDVEYEKDICIRVDSKTFFTNIKKRYIKWDISIITFKDLINKFKKDDKKISESEMKYESEDKDTPDYYKINVNGNIVSVYDILKGLDKKLDEYNVDYSRMKFLVWSGIIQYILRAPFKGMNNRDLEESSKCIKKLLKMK